MLQHLDARVNAVTDELACSGEPIRYLGSLLMRADEVVLCRFEGSETAVRNTAEPSSPTSDVPTTDANAV